MVCSFIFWFLLAISLTERMLSEENISLSLHLVTSPCADSFGKPWLTEEIHCQKPSSEPAFLGSAKPALSCYLLYYYRCHRCQYATFLLVFPSRTFETYPFNRFNELLNVFCPLIALDTQFFAQFVQMIGVWFIEALSTQFRLFGRSVSAIVAANLNLLAPNLVGFPSGELYIAPCPYWPNINQ